MIHLTNKTKGERERIEWADGISHVLSPPSRMAGKSRLVIDEYLPLG
jgi:hypothetical protein